MHALPRLATAMNHATSWHPAAAHLHTAAADATAIAAQRENTTSDPSPACPGIGNTASPSSPPTAAGSRYDIPMAHPARVYGCWLGGKDHYEADRKAAQEVARHRPQVVTGARANRRFLAQVVRFLAEG
jgi:hypothetical protein